jgi:hypothetical protein
MVLHKIPRLASAKMCSSTFCVQIIAVNDEGVNSNKMENPQAIIEKLEYELKATERRTRMADALNNALELYISSDEDFLDIISDGIRPIADSMGLDKVFVYRYVAVSEGEHLYLTYVWDKAQGGTVQINDELSDLPDTQIIKDWSARLMSGQTINCRIRDIDDEAAAFFHEHGIKAIHVSPVFVKGEFWGIISMQDHTSDEFFAEDSIEGEMLQAAARVLAKAFIRSETERRLAKEGEMLKKIGIAARLDIERLLGSPIFLQLWVKVKKDWRNSDFYLKNFGYDVREAL